MVSLSYYHGCLGVSEAEKRLRDSGEDGAYLLRESDVKKGIFVISSINDSSIAHFFPSNCDGKFLRQTYEEASQIVGDIVETSKCYIFPVTPAAGSLKKLDIKSESLDKRSTCYCCRFTSEDHKILEKHKRTHKLSKCYECKRWFKRSTYLSLHRRGFCNKSLDTFRFECQLCGYKTNESSKRVKLHKMMHQRKPFLCKEENCRRCYKTDEELTQHTIGFHLNKGFKCDECDKRFQQRCQKTRHMLRMHQRPPKYDNERGGCLILSKNGDIEIKIDEGQNKRARSYNREMIQAENLKKKVNITSPYLSQRNISCQPKTATSRSVIWTCVNDVIELSEETVFQDISVVCQDGLVRSSKIILSSLFPALISIFSSMSDPQEVDTIIFPDAKSNDLRQLLEQFFIVNKGATAIESGVDMKEDFDIEELDPLDDDIILDIEDELKSELMDDEPEMIDDEEEDKEEKEIETNILINLEEGFEPGLNSDGSNNETKTFELKVTTEMKSNDKGRSVVKCPLCNFKIRAYQKEKLVIHFKSKHTNISRSKSVPCPLCGVMNADMEKHNSRFHTEVTCEICGVTLKNRFKYFEHRYKKHGKNIVPEGMKRCKKCKELVHDDEFEQHSCQTQFPCEICGKIYHNTISLEQHVSIKHSEKSKIKYNCDQCGKQFVSKASLIKHLKTHDPMTPCPQCGKLVRNLEDHIQVIHTADSDKKFVCKDCGKGFITKDKLDVHQMNVHLKLRPHSCRYEGCSVSFNDVSNRNQHEKRVHGALFKKKVNP